MTGLEKLVEWLRIPSKAVVSGKEVEDKIMELLSEEQSKPPANADLVELAQRVLDCVYVPERNCSCHICAPCSDCEENSGARELIKECNKILNRYRHAVDTKGKI